jgi:hypothetical protein
VATYRRKMKGARPGAASGADQGRGLAPYVRSVASLLVSRWDLAVADEVREALRNTLGTAFGQATYHAYRNLLESHRFQRLQNLGARPPRLLFATTGTKDRSASNTLYVAAVAVPNTVIGIGGSYLGPELAYRALRPFSEGA